MTIKEESNSGYTARGPALWAVGGLLGALAASSCCILPLVLFSVGVSGAWIGQFTRLAPYQPIFVAITLICLSAGAWLVHRASKAPCTEGVCARPLSHRLVKSALLVTALLVAVAVAFDLLGPLLLNS